MKKALSFTVALISGLAPAATVASVLTIPPPVTGHPADQNPVQVQTGCEHTGTSFSCVIFHSNYDGDTLTVSIPNVHPLLGNKVSVRLYGIDAPEMHSEDACEHEAALLARKFVRGMLTKGQRIDLLQVQRDKYFRILSDVRVDGESVSRALIARGLAYPYFGGTKQSIDWCPARAVTVE